jgi:pimeloyl-ACP methyl ester carboxylesterase
MKVDLLAGEQDQDRWEAFDVSGAAERIRSAAIWLRSNPETRSLPIGVYAEGVGAAAALSATAENSQELSSMIEAVVCRCGRPDLASESLSAVTKPTLLIVGEADRPIAELNRTALRELGGIKEFAMIAGAGQLFDEPAAMEQANQLTRKWYTRFLSSRDSENAAVVSSEAKAVNIKEAVPAL